MQCSACCVPFERATQVNGRLMDADLHCDDTIQMDRCRHYRLQW